MTRRTTLAAGVTALAATIPALLVAPIASAHSEKVDGVRAEVKHDGTLKVKGSQQADRIALRLKAGDPTVVQVDVGDNGTPDFSFARAGLTAIKVKARKGDDSVRIDDSQGAFTNTIPTQIAGGAGDDTLTGGAGNETYRGDKGNDLVDGNGGVDTGYLGEGEDTFRWDPGDGSDVVEGQAGTDKLLFNGAPAAEQVTLSPNGGRLKFFRVQANITMDTDDVEVVDFNALGGADTITVNDLSGTDVKQTNLDLAATLGGNAGDNVGDSVVVNATDGVDNIAVTGAGNGADVTGLSNTVSVKHADPAAADKLTVHTLAGDDNVITAGVAGVLDVLVD